MKLVWVCLGILAVLIPTAVLAQQPPVGAWQVYTTAHGLSQLQSNIIVADGAEGVWVGHVSGGRGIFWRGGLSHVAASGGQAYTQEPFASCSSVDALALAPDRTLWMRLSGWHDYGHTDHLQACGPRYGVADPSGYEAAAIGFIGADGVPHMLPREHLPPELVRTSDSAATGLAVDARGRVWAGTRDGVAVREADGSWRSLRVWQGDERGTVALTASLDGTLLAIGSATGDVATIAVAPGQAEQVRVLPRPVPERPTTQYLPVGGLAFGPDGVAVTLGRALYRQAGDGWRATELPLPPGRDDLPTRLAYAGGSWWSGSVLAGLQRLDGQSWTPVRAGATPLPSDAIYDLAAEDASTLLIATAGGAARLATSGPSPDPRAAQQAFDTLWQRTNRGANGTWVWGPSAWAERYEPYLEAPGGSRTVRYYDKTRMEATQPGADPGDPYYVTNGLLVTEMVNGIAQYGDDAARGACPLSVPSACPATVVVAGDLENNQRALTYGNFKALQAAAPARIGVPIGATLLKAQSYEQPTVGDDPSLATNATRVAEYDTVTQHNIAGVFWTFLQAQPVAALYGFGHPLTEPYWIRTNVGGVEQWVLIQLFERRTLTYTPGNAPDWQVEMGNVGQHYFAWRYAQVN